MRSVWLVSRSASNRRPRSAANDSLSAAPRMMAWIRRVRARIRQLYSTILFQPRRGIGQLGDDGHHVSSSAAESCGPVMSMTPFEQAALTAEGEIDGFRRHSSVVGDGGHRGPRVAAVDEESPGRLENSAAGLLRLVGAQR